MPTPTGTREALVFFVRDPSKFQDFIRSQKRMPGTGLRSSNMQWDFWSLSPESLHQVAILMSDRGTLRTWRHMNGYGSHTFMWINAAGKRVWVKYHFETEQGIQNFTAAEATTIAATSTRRSRRRAIRPGGLKWRRVDPDLGARIARASASPHAVCPSKL